MTNPLVSASILAFPETTASMLYGFFDVLSSVGVTWPELVKDQAGDPLIQVRIVAASREPFECWGGVIITPHATLEEVTNTDLICIPEMASPGDESPRGRYPREAEWLARMYVQGATIGAACSGSMLLADTGLLDGAEATTHWGLKRRFESFYPEVTVRTERILCFAGEGHRLVTAGGQSSWHDMILYLVARFCGVKQAIDIAKVFLFAEHVDGQSLYASALIQAQHTDAIIGDCQGWIARHYDTAQPVTGMVRCSGLAPRTFARRFRAATDYQPMEYVQALRIEESKQLLETTAHKVDHIAREVGYEDPASFRRLFKRNTGLTPSQYRRKLGGLRILGASKA